MIKVIHKLIITFCFVLCGCLMLQAVTQNTNEVKAENKKVLLLFDDPYQVLDTMINDICAYKNVDAYPIQSQINIQDYDIILIGESIDSSNTPSIPIKNFLTSHNLNNKMISYFWVGGTSHDTYESQLRHYINNSYIISGIGLNGDEISEVSYVKDSLHQWLDTIV